MNKLLKFLLRIFYIFPVKRNRISFICYDAKQYCCSPKAISDYILEKYGNDYEHVWYYRDDVAKAAITNKSLKIYKWKSLRCIIKLMTSKYIVTNISVPAAIPYRKSQIKLNTWHGAAFKHYHSSGVIYEVVFKSKKIADVKQAKEKERKKSKPLTSNVPSSYDLCEYFIVENEISAQVTQDRNGFNFHNTLVKIGMPRNDCIIKADDEIKRKIKAQICAIYGIKEDSKILLYAPTFRDNCETDFCNLDFVALQKALSDKFGGEWVICVRKHHLLKGLKKELWKGETVDFSDYPDMQSLLIVADILITDYSSCMWDFSLAPKAKPCFIYASDIERYVNSDRGEFYYPIDKLPFPLSVDNESLLKNIAGFNETQYAEKIKEYHTNSGRFNYDGRATEKAVELLFSHNDKNKNK